MSTLIDEVNTCLGTDFVVNVRDDAAGNLRAWLERSDGYNGANFLDSDACEEMAEAFKELAAHLRRHTHLKK